MLRKQPKGEQDEIVEIHRVTGAKGRLIPRLNMLGHSAEALVGKRPGALSAVSEPAQQRQDGRRIGFFSPRRELRQDFLNRCSLLRFIINDEISLVPQLFNVLPQDAHAEGMKSADCGLRVES